MDHTTKPYPCPKCGGLTGGKPDDHFCANEYTKVQTAPGVTTIIPIKDNMKSREELLCTRIVQECAIRKQELYTIRNHVNELPSLREQLLPEIDKIYAAFDSFQQKAASIGNR